VARESGGDSGFAGGVWLADSVRLTAYTAEVTDYAAEAHVREHHG